MSDAGDPRLGLAGEEIPSAAGIAVSAVPAVPAHSQALARSPSGNTWSDGVDHPNHFMSGNSRVLNPGQVALFGERIAVTDPARLDSDSDGAGGRLRNIALDNLERAIGARHLNATHLGHETMLAGFASKAVGSAVGSIDGLSLVALA
jgi:hypothetical protein